MVTDVIPFDKREGSLWLDGKFVPWADAKIHVLTHGLHYASSVFEGERMYSGRIYKLEEHTQRLFKSTQILDMKIPFSVKEISDASIKACEIQGFKDAYVRPVVWRGSEQMSVAGDKNHIHVAIAAWQWGSYFNPAEKMKGIRLSISDWKRPAPDTAPTAAKAAGLYMICTISKHAAEREGFADAMMLDWRGYVAEATGANVFFIRDGVLHTPEPDCFLDGLTRQSVMALARSRGFEIVQRHIRPEELSTFSECFIVGTAAEVTPVSQVGDYRFKPGDISLSLMDDYARMVRREVQPA